MLISGLYRNGRLYDPDDPNEVDPGRLAFGQERLVVTPLQMALVAAGVANEGIVMEPKLVERIVAPDGDVIQRFEPQEWTKAVEPSGSRPDGDDGAGSAVRHRSRRPDPRHLRRRQDGHGGDGSRGRNNTWFIAFARPQTARRSPSRSPSPDQAGTGGATAARSRAPSSRRPSGEMPNL